MSENWYLRTLMSENWYLRMLKILESAMDTAEYLMTELGIPHYYEYDTPECLGCPICDAFNLINEIEFAEFRKRLRHE